MRHILVVFLFCLANTAWSQTQTYTSTGSFTVPDGVTSVIVECWGGGGAGGGNTSSNDGGGGGGGGAYAKSTISVTPGTAYSVTVGTGPNGGSGNGSSGGDSWFINASTVMAKGGSGGSTVSGGNPGNGGAGGSSALSVGTTKFAGGTGGTGRNNNSGQGGPGGSSAGTSAIGTSGAGTWSTVTAAAAPSGGGIGGNGGTSGNDGSNGGTPGGGGGGAGDNNSTGGDGARGQVIITWTCSNTLTSGAGSNIQSLCKNSSITAITYSIVGATGAGVSGLPTGVTGTYSSGVFTISGAPSVTGTFNYTVTPTGSCTSNTSTGTITVNGPTANVGSALSSICQNGTSGLLGGSVSGTATGGTWSDGAIGGAFNPNATTLNGTYSPPSGFSGTVVLTLTSSGGSCGTASASKNLTVVAQPTASGSGGSQTICAGGSATVSGISASNGTISWTENGAGSITSGGATVSPTYTSQAGDAGNTVTLTMTVTGNPCTVANATYTVLVNALPSISVSPASPNVCLGSGVSLTVSGASTYLWSPAGSLSASTGATVIASPSVNTTYTVTGTDANSCTKTSTVTVTIIPAPSAVTVTPSSTTICSGGSVSLAASGGPLVSTVTSGTGSSTTSSNTSSSTLGPNPLQNYYGGMKQQTMWRASELTALGLISGSKINSITINLAAAGTTYALLNYRVKYQLSPSITSLSTTPITTGWATIYGPQSYTPNVGLNTFTFTSPITWDGSSSLILEFNFSNNNTGSTGTLNTATFNTGIGYTATNFYRADNVTAASVDAFSSTVNFSYSSRNNVQFNITQPVTYAWLPATGLNTTSGTPVIATPSVSTTYTVSGTLSNGCASTATSVVNIDPAISISFSQSDVSCNGGSNGSATASPSGGNGSYTAYLWSDGQTTSTATGLIAGTYSVTVTDGIGCTASNSVTITQPAALVASCSVVSNVSCNGGTNGAADVTASGGTAPYTGTGSFTGLAAGSYTYNISDANGCTASCSVTISEPAALVATCSVVANVSCNGGTDGAADVTASGGTTPYTGTGSFTGLAAGSYTYNISDANGCTASCTVTITEPAVLSASCSVASNVSCNGGADGVVTVTGSGGTAPYSVSPSPNGLTAGSYTFTITDANGCTTTCSETITEPTVLSASCSWVSDASCNGGSDGSASVSATGGTAPYSGTGLIAGLSAGTQTLTVTDANGCTATCSVTINEPTALVATCSVVSHVSCNGGTDGAADVIASGGTSPYTGTGSFTGLAAGAYTYNISDANGCTASCSVTITEPAALVATCSVVANVSCNGGTDGAADVSASGGTAPYTGTGSFTGLAAGSYTYNISDANGCTASCSVTITEPAVLVATCSVVSHVSCNGGTDGAADVSASGGTAPYTGTGSFTGLAAGSYTYNISDANGCTASCSVTITEPTVLLASCTFVSDVTCNGGADGSASVSASGGTAPYSGTGLITGLSAGTQTLTVTDANGCTATCSVTISEPAALVATCSIVSHVSCNGGTDGAADVTASGGTAPYTGTGSFTGLAAGSYTYNVSDANGCTASCSVTITEPAALVATCSVVSHVSCNGGTDGAADVSASGGTAPYTGTGSFTGLAAGSYTYNISDANGCTASCSVTITEPAALVATCSVVSHVSCNGGTDGAADVTASGGTAPYTGTGSFTGLAAGTYTYNVSDANGCTASCSVTITEPAVLLASCTFVSDVTCNGGSDGSASVSASGGTAPYTGTGLITGLSAGTQTLTVTDANGCTTTCSVTISEPAALVASCSVVSHVSCNGGTDGAADVSASGGTAPYTGTGSFTGLAAGTYTYNVSDANGCTASCSVTITEPAALVATCSVVSHVSCNGGTDGAADVIASGGIAPYTGTGSFTGLAAGTYTYNVSDANGCTASCSVTITEPAALVATCSVVSHVSCNGGSDGSASVSASGGTAPYTGTGSFTGLAAGSYTYNISDANGCTASCSVTITEPAVMVATCTFVSDVTCNGGSDGSASVSASGGTAPYSGTGLIAGLSAGTQTLTVTDANGCTATCSVTISEPAALVATCSVVSNVSCNGGTDGAADVTASGGTAPYTGTGSFTGLAAGSYTYNISDANGCTASCSVTITEPAVLVATCSVVSHVSCNGGTDGAADVTASGGTAPYTGTGSFTGLAAGTYTYNVSDANGCTASCSVTITEPAALVATCSVVANVSCNGGTDGAADVTASGGTAPYTGTGSFTGLAAGSYTYNISDANGCTASCSVTITEPAALVATCSVVSNVTCNGGTDGAADVTASGGTAPYTGTGSFTGLAAGSYTYNVSDANGCAASCSVTITEPAALVATCSVVSNVSCNGGTDGAADVTASGGTAPYTGTGSFTGLAAGTYTYNVSDASGCTASCSVTITEPAALVATCSVVSNVSCNGGTDGAADVTASGGTAPYTGTGSFTGLAAGSYTYNISDANGCTASCSVTITEPAVLVATCSVTANVSCNGGTDGAADVTASGGTAPYTGTGSFTGLAAGSYTYNISDANGCTASCSVTITEPTVLLASCTFVSDVTCNGGSDGTASVSASGGTAPYSGVGLVIGLPAGNQTLTVTDANGCTSTCTVVISEPTALVATCSVVANVSCNGGTNGAADVTASGGTAPYTGTGSFTGLAAGSYTYNISDANGCTASCSVTITEPAALVATCSVVANVSCNGGTDGAADVTASGGTAPYTGTGSFTGLAAGTYTYNVSDASGCTASCSVTITEPAALVATCSVVSHVSCNGGSDGSADVTASGGTAPYTGTGSFTGLAAGSYTYNISDANGCTASCSVTITEPAALVATCSVVSHVSCNGGSDGSADVTASGGTAPYTGTGSFTGLAAGTYTYNVSDANGCTASCSVTITEPAALVATCSVVSNVSCNGGTDGAADVTASGGTAPYTGTGSFTGLAAGTYTYNVTDANGCTASCSVTITEPAALVATCSVTANVSCNGGTDGAADVTASGGTAPYTGTGSFTGLAAGTYTYNVTDANGCTASCSVTITEPAALVATCSVVSNVSCNGGTDGAADVTASGGTAPYTGTGSFTGLAAGTYTYNVSDANGCTASCSVTITEPAALVATCSVVSNVSCNGGTDGAADVTASGGTAPYTGTGSFTGLAAGTYTYNVSDANGCTASCSVTITEPAALVATCSVVSHVSCNGGSDGSADVTASGGTSPYTGTGSFTGLAAGTYTYNVSDANGCTASCSVTITEPAALVATCSVVSHVSCNGGSDGSADVTASGGTAPYTGTGSFTGLAAGTYTYNVSDASGCTASCSVTITEPAALVATCSVVSHVSCNGGTDGATDVSASGGTAPYTGTGSFTGLAAGTYTYNVSDANGCTASCSVTITEPAALVATCSVVSHVSCNGGSDGSADVTASGGTAPYTGTGSFTGLAAGTYTYNVSDANGCTASCSVTITEPAALVATCSVVSHVSCNGGTDGAADVTASGGTAPYTGTGSFTGLAAGTYTYNVTDANGCTASCSVTITEPAALVATCSVVSHVSCNGGSDGAADVTASGGTAPYTGTGSFTGLAAGTYTYNVSDANGCTASCSVTITEPAALVATCSVVSHVSCNGGTDGAADVTASGGTAPYTGTGSFTGLAAGTYTYNVSDANGCTASCSVTITEPAALVATCSVVSHVSCNGGTDGSADVTASGGTAPYTGTGSFTGLAAGTYTYNVTDANGCTASCSVTITEPAALVATCSVTANVSCNGGTDGAADVTASGGAAPYTGTGSFTGLAAGTYTYNVSDANGCTATCSVTITEPAALVATCSVVSHVSCNGGTDGSADVTASGGTAPYTGTGSFTGLAAGTYTYNVSDANGCTASCSVTITEPAALVATCSVTANVSCNGGSDGSADVTASGGAAPYTGTGSFTGLAAGTYTYNVSDANGCTATCSVTITEPAALVATCSVVSHVSCNGGTDGAADVTASGGTAPYTGTGSFTGLAAGTYTYNVSDANGCTATCSVTITEPAALVATCSVVSHVSCNGGTDGAADVTASGGTAPYTGTGSFTGLAAGTYTYNVSDANGCTSSCSVTITEPAALVATCSVVSNVSCNGGTDGAADVTASGGTAPYTGTGSFTGLAAGTYTYNVSDANGCTATCSVTITEPAALVATCSVVSHVSCNGGTDGAADVTASGGTAPYTGTGSFTGLAAGTYTYNVSDASGCAASCSVTITEPAALVATCSVVSHVSCNGGTDGAADVSASGGTAPYTGTGSFTGLAAGTYTYNVSDANGCTASCSVTITEPAVLTLVCTPTNESFPGASNGSVDVVASGGTAPYSGDGLFSGLAAGTYTYTVTDANGCSASCTSTVGTDCIPSTDPSGATASSSDVCLGNNVTLQVVGGSLGTFADWVWYEGGCGAGSSIGTGASISVPVTTLGTHTYFVRAEGLCGTTLCATVSITGISLLPAPITILSAPLSGCIGGSGTVTCSTVAGATGYNWNAPAGVLINGVSGPVVSASTTVTVTFTALPPTGISGWNVCVSGINACGTSPNTKCYWIRATISVPSPIVGSVIGCPSTSNTYSVTPVDGAAQYVWSVTGAAGLNGGGATVTTVVPNVTVNFAGGFTAGQLCVFAKTSCGYSGGSRCLSIAAAPGLPGVISGSTTICPGSSSVYTISPVAGAATYVWTTTGTGVSVVGSGTSATVSTTAAFTSGSVCVVAVSSCGSPIGNSAQRCKTLGTGKLATPGNITGDPTTGVCGQTYQYSIPSISGATSGYFWSIPAGVTVIGPSNSNSITLQFPSNFVSGTLCVNGVNGCGNGFARCANVFGNPGTPASISGANSVCVGSTEVYTWPAVPGATSYQVFVPAGTMVLTGTPTVTNSSVIQWGSTAGNVGVKAVNGCGVSGTRTLAVSISCRIAQSVNESNAVETMIYPNPAHGQFNVSFNSTIAETFTLKVVDQTGRIVKEEMINAQEGNNVQQLDVNDLALGVYLVVLESKQTGLSKYPLLLQ